MRLTVKDFAPRKSGLLLLSLLIIPFATTFALDNGYFVGAHSIQNFAACRAANALAGDLYHTQEDTAGFLGSLPAWMHRNYFYAEQNVWSNHWSIWDFYEDGGSANGYTGIDSNYVAYISTHGVTSRGVFYISMGTPNYGGCSANSSTMRLGDKNLRYLFFSTCQSVKVGDGANPNTPGENPAQTWGGSMTGVHCIFGYSSNSFDNPNYGKFFWKYVNNVKPLTNAFLDASWEISHGQVPAVVCFGQNPSESEGKLNSPTFLHSSIRSITNYASWRLYNMSPSRYSDNLLSTSLGKLASLTSPSESPGNLKFYSQIKVGPRTQDLLPAWKNFFDKFRKVVIPHESKEVSFSDDEAIKIAIDFLKQENLLPSQKQYHVAGVRLEQEAHTQHPQPVVVRKTVILQQKVGPLLAVDSSSEIRVTLDDQKRIVDVYGGSRQVTPAMDFYSLSFLEAQIPKAKLRIMRKIRKQMGMNSSAELGGQYKFKLVELRLGYDLGKEEIANLQFHGSVEVTMGQYTKLFQVGTSITD